MLVSDVLHLWKIIWTLKCQTSVKCDLKKYISANAFLYIFLSVHLKPKLNVCCCNSCVFIYLFIGCIYNRLYWVGSQWILFFFNCFLLNAASGARTEILKQQQLLAVNVSSPPTRDTGLCHRTSSGRLLSHSPRSSHWSHNRSVCSLHSV